MTVQEMIEQVFGDAGEPTDLWIYKEDGETFDLTTTGSQRILALLNRAYRRVTNWKLPTGQIIRFATCNKRLAFATNVVSLTVSSVSGTNLILSSTAKAIDDKYNQWIIEIGSERRLIRDYTGSTRKAYIHKAFDATIANGTAATLYKKFFNFGVWDSTVFHTGEIIRLAQQNGVQAVQSLYDVTSERMLEKVRRDDATWSQLFDGPGEPGQYQQTGDGIEFDAVPTNGIVYMMRYYGLPEVLADADQEPRIPDPWHDVIVMMASWYRMKTDRETDDAYALKRDIDDSIARIVQQLERSLDFEDGALYIAEE